MPKFDQMSITPRQGMPDISQPQVQTEVVASPVNIAVRPAENNMTRLANALGGFMQAGGQKYLEAQAEQQRKAEEAQGFKAGKTGEAVPPTASPWFQQGFNKATWETHAIDSTNDVMGEYATHKNDPGFDLGKMLQAKMQEDLRGVTDPTAISTYMERFGPISAKLKTDLAQTHVEDVMRTRDTNMNIQMADMVRRSTAPETANGYPSTSHFIEDYAVQSRGWIAQGKTQPEIDHAFLQAIEANSKTANGNPHAFDVFYEVDPTTGHSIVERNPAMAKAVADAKYRAEALHDNYLTKDSWEANRNAVFTLEQDIRSNPFDPSIPTRFQEYSVGEHSPFGRLGGHAGSMSSLWNLYQSQMQTQQDGAVCGANIEAGHGALCGKEGAKAYMNRMLAPDLHTLATTLNDPNAFVLSKDGKVAESASVRALNNILTLTNKSGTNIMLEQVTNLFNGVSQKAPPLNDKNATVPTEFKNLSMIYQQAKSSSSPALASQLGDEDSRRLMDSYNWQVSQGVNENDAWRKAFSSRDPEVRTAKLKELDTPEGRKLVTDSIAGNASGIGSNDSGWLPDWFRQDGTHWYSPLTRLSRLGLNRGMEKRNGDGTYPSNYDSIAPYAYEEAKSFLANTEGASLKDVGPHLKEWVNANYLHDETMNKVVRVPPEFNTREGVEAFSAFSAKLQQEKGHGVQVDYKWRGNGQYSIEITSAEGKFLNREYPNITAKDIVNSYKAEKVLTPEETKVLNTLDTQARDGTLTASTAHSAAGVITKARQAGLLSSALTNGLEGVRELPAFSGGGVVQEVNRNGLKPTAINPTLSTLPDIGPRKAVLNTMRQLGDHAGVLAVMGEGVVLKAYKDTHGSTTVGIGYNMDANAKNAEEDFRRAGINSPVEAIHSGKVSLSTEQAVRLYQVVKPRYEAIAQNAYDTCTKQPGAYNSMSPQERAVLTDIAYQSGGNVAKYTELMGHLLHKDSTLENIGNALKRTYRSSADGKADQITEHRRNLRLALLTGRLDGSLRHAGMIQ
ncbi:MAG TPA: hypothetical protein VFK88_09575 [Gallionella sp.]|nr:hypothetical protein [Gallionella sp.]